MFFSFTKLMRSWTFPFLLRLSTAIFLLFLDKSCSSSPFSLLVSVLTKNVPDESHVDPLASPHWEVLEVSRDDGETGTAAQQPCQEIHLSASNQTRTRIKSSQLGIINITNWLLIKSLGIPPTPTNKLSGIYHATVYSVALCSISTLQDYQVRSAE